MLDNLVVSALFASERRHAANHSSLGIGSGKYCRNCANIRYELERRVKVSPMFCEAAS